MQKYDVVCSNVWDSNIALSATAPCTALSDHNMMLVYANTVPCTDNVGQDTNMDTFYHNMKYITLQTKGRVLRHRPYTMPPCRSVHIPPQSSTSRDNIISSDTQDETIPLALYYGDQWATLSAVIKSDGRFVSSVECEDAQIDQDTKMVEVEPGEKVVLIGRYSIVHRTA